MPYRSRIPQIIIAIQSETATAVNRAGFEVEREAKDRARVDTGYMRGQIRWMLHGRFSGEVVGGADYTIDNEFGTAFMSAQPMFVPAAEAVRPRFEAEMRAALRKAVG